MFKLLVLDSSYSFEAISNLGLEDSVTCRDLDGFFDHVWTVHPFGTLVTSSRWTNKYGRPDIYQLAPAHTFIEGKMGMFNVLRKVVFLNFLIGQIHILFYLIKLIKKEKISVIRVGSPLYLGLFGLALSRWCKIPFVVRVGGNHDKMYETTGQQQEKRIFRHRRIEKLVERFVFSRADLVAGANQDNLNFALNNGARPDRSTLFRYGNLIDRRHFVEPSQREGGNDLLDEIGVGDTKFLLYVGRLETVKQPDDVIRVLAQLVNRGYQIKAVLAGDGKLRSNLENFARTLGVENHTLFVGNVDQDWLARVVPRAAVVVSPHTGRALCETALGGAPIVAYDIDWQGELIETGVTGELVPHGDCDALAKCVQLYLDNQIYAQKMGDAVRKRCSEMMNSTALNNHEREQYLKLLTMNSQESNLSLKRTKR